MCVCVCVCVCVLLTPSMVHTVWFTAVGVCAAGSLGCTHSCVGESCICRQGFQLADDNTTCGGEDCVCVCLCVCVLGHPSAPSFLSLTPSAFSFLSLTPSASFFLSLLPPLPPSLADVNECAAGTDGCSHYCINEEGGYRCTCPPRLFLATDGLTCEGGPHECVGHCLCW